MRHLLSRVLLPTLSCVVCLLLSTFLYATALAASDGVGVQKRAAVVPIVIRPPAFPVNNAAWSPDGQCLATGNFDGTLQTWNAVGGQLFVTHLDSGRSIYTRVLGWSRDGRSVISYSSQSSQVAVERWDAATGKVLLTIVPKETAPQAVLSPDGTKIAFLGSAITIVDASNGRQLRTFGLRASLTGNDLQWSPDGTRIAIINFDVKLGVNYVEVWNAVNGQHLTAYYAPSRQFVGQFTWFPDSKRLLSASSGLPTILQSWSASNGKVLFTYPLHPTSVEGLSVSPNSKSLAIQGYSTLQVWNAANGKAVFTAGSDQTAITGSAWSPDGTKIALVGNNYPLQVRTATTGHIVLTYSHATNFDSVLWSTNGKYLATPANGTGVLTWSASVNKQLALLPARHQIESTISWSPDGTQIAAEDGATYDMGVWNTQTGVNIGDFSFYHEQLGRYRYSNIPSVAWSPNGANIAQTSGANVVVWGNVPIVCASSQCAQDGGDHTNMVTQVAWSPDNLFVASASLDKTVIVYDVANQKNHSVYSGHTSPVTAVSWSPDGRTLASGATDGSVHLWDPNTGTVLTVLHLHSKAITSIAWSPDNTRIAIASLDGTVTLWDIHGTLLFTYRGHIGAVNNVSWSPDGTKLASAGVDKQVRVWSASTGATTFIYKGHRDEVKAVAWSPDGKRIASGSSDGTVQLWSPA